MFCPNCRCEYREGYYVCADCDIKLVDELPPEPDPDFIDFVPLLSTFNQCDISLMKGILESEKIEFFFKGELFNILQPLARPAVLMINENQYEDAKKLLQDFEVSFFGLNLGVINEQDEYNKIECYSCGATIEVDNKYCPNCGKYPFKE